MVELVEARLDIAFDNPVGRSPCPSIFLQGRVATAIGSEPMTGVVKVRCVGAIIDRFEDHANDLSHDFVSYTWNAEFAHFPIRLWDKSLPDGFEAELLGTHLLDDRVNDFTRKSVERFPVASWRHVSGF